MKNIVIALILMTTPCLVSAHDDFGVRMQLLALTCAGGTMAIALTEVGPMQPITKTAMGVLAISLFGSCIISAVVNIAKSDLLASEIRENETFAQLASVFGEETLFEAIELRTQGASKLKILTHIINNSDYIDFEFLPDPDELKNQAQWKIF